MLPSRHRLNAKHFKTIYTEGKKYRGIFGMLIVRNSSTPYSQFGFVVSKKVGNSVQRHKVTRLLRQITFDTITKYKLEEKPFQCQYISFKYCDSYEELNKEYSKQIIDAFRVN
jgi:ribonuclease P protein component